MKNKNPFLSPKSLSFHRNLNNQSPQPIIPKTFRLFNYHQNQINKKNDAKAFPQVRYSLYSSRSKDKYQNKQNIQGQNKNIQIDSEYYNCETDKKSDKIKTNYNSGSSWMNQNSTRDMFNSHSNYRFEQNKYNSASNYFMSSNQLSQKTKKQIKQQNQQNKSNQMSLANLQDYVEVQNIYTTSNPFKFKFEQQFRKRQSQQFSAPSTIYVKSRTAVFYLYQDPYQQ